MTGTETQDEDLARLAEAAAWRVALHEADQETSAEFEAWLAADARNGHAWAQVQAPWDYIGQNATAPEAMALREEVLQRARRVQGRRYTARKSPSTRIAASVAAALLLAGLIGVGLWAANRPDVYQTALGERRVVTLADGSRVALDSGTLLRVRLGRDSRKLDLVRGQARFDVAHDVTRPFSVHARDQLVVATGTSFNIDLLGPKVLVTLLEGKVTVLRDGAESLNPLSVAEPRRVVARLTAGQQLITVEAVAPVAAQPSQPIALVATANLDRATAWENGQLVFENEPLAAVAERVSRYSADPLTVEGAAANLRISGVFNAGDVTTFVDAVQHGLPVRADRTGNGGIVLKLKGG